MNEDSTPMIFRLLQAEGFLQEADITHTQDGFYFANRSLAGILAKEGILDFLDSEGREVACSNLFDDWFLYAVPDEIDYVYSLLKLREQEHDQGVGVLADGDMPGVTICFIAFNYGILLECLQEPTAENRQKLAQEIQRVVVKKGQRHNEALKRYFTNPKSEGSYLVADRYIKSLAALAEQGYLPVPDRYSEFAEEYLCGKNFRSIRRLPRFIEGLNQEAGYTVCDHEKIYIQNPAAPNRYESAAILATHAGNTSVYSFAAEVELHARFLVPLARIRVPLMGSTLYDSAIRADLTVEDAEAHSLAPFYNPKSRIVTNQYRLHKDHGPL